MNCCRRRRPGIFPGIFSADFPADFPADGRKRPNGLADVAYKKCRIRRLGRAFAASRAR